MWTNVVTLAVVALAANAAWAQEEDRRTERMLERLKERLSLSEEQYGKVQEIVRATREAEDKAQKERDEKIRELLTDDQRRQYDELRRNPFGGERVERGGPGGGGRGPMAWMERMLAPNIDQIKKELELDDDQTAKVKEVLDAFTEEMRERFNEMRQQGFQGFNWQEEGQKFQERIGQLVDKVKTWLNDDQKTKLDKLVQERFGRFGGFGRPNRTESPRARPSVDERVKRAMEALHVESSDEATVIQAEVKKAVEAAYALEDYERDLRSKIEEAAQRSDLTDDEAKAKIEELRAGRRERERALRDAQRALSEIVSYRQELELIRTGILR